MLMISYSSIQAQDSSSDESYNSQARFGIRGGVTIASQRFEDGNLDDDSKSKFGADVAVLFDIPIGSGVFMLQPELHWLQKGSVIDDISGDDITNTFNYLNYHYYFVSILETRSNYLLLVVQVLAISLAESPAVMTSIGICMKTPNGVSI